MNKKLALTFLGGLILGVTVVALKCREGFKQKENKLKFYNIEMKPISK